MKCLTMLLHVKRSLKILDLLWKTIKSTEENLSREEGKHLEGLFRHKYVSMMNGNLSGMERSSTGGQYGKS